jgi:hypothetical protein
MVSAKNWSEQCWSTIHVGQLDKKMKDTVSSVEVAYNNRTGGDHILHEQESHTKYGISGIHDEIDHLCQPEAQQKQDLSYQRTELEKRPYASCILPAALRALLCLNSAQRFRYAWTQA